MYSCMCCKLTRIQISDLPHTLASYETQGKLCNPSKEPSSQLKNRQKRTDFIWLVKIK